MKANTPKQRAELNTYTVLATIQDYFHEVDGDIHIVLQDIAKPQVTMIAEMPNDACARVKGSSYLNDFRTVRKTSNTMKRKNIKWHQFYFTGVAFF